MSGLRAAARIVAAITALAYVVAVVAGYVFWGLRYGTVAAAALTLYVAIPLWVASRFLDIDTRWAPTRARIWWVLLGATLFAYLGLATIDFEGEKFEPLARAGLALLLAIAMAAPIALFVLSIIRTDTDRETPFLEPTVARGVVLGLVGLILGLSSLLLLLGPFAAWMDPYLMTNNREAFARLAGAWTWIGLAAISLGAAYPAAWSFGLVQTGFLSASYAAAKARRREAIERLRGRLDDHYALHRVRPETHNALRALLLQERDGQVPGEARYILSRGALTRMTVLGILLLATAGIVLAGAGQSKEWNTEALQGDEPEQPYWPCTDCQTAAEYEAFLDQVHDWRTWTYLMVATIVGLGLFALLLVPYLGRTMRSAQAEAATFWAERDRLEAQMLEEIRDSTAAPSQ